MNPQDPGTDVGAGSLRGNRLRIILQGEPPDSLRFTLPGPKRIMTRIILPAILGLGFLMVPVVASAQTPDSALAVSSGGQGLFRVNVDAGALWGGTYDGDIDGDNVPAEGAGTRMMWYPNKAAFRAGQVNGTQWDAANIGEWSVAIGQNARASGSNSTAFGWN